MPNVENIMSEDMLSVETQITIREAAQRISERNARGGRRGPGLRGRPGLITERDMLESIVAGHEPD